MVDYRNFYVRYPGYPGYLEGKIVNDTRENVVLDKIAMILFTNKGECIADPDLGCDLEFYLWQTRVSADRIRAEIEEQVRRYIPELRMGNFYLNVRITQGELRDILLIDIYVNENEFKAVLL